MSSTDVTTRAWPTGWLTGWAAAARLGRRDYLALYPWPVLLLSALPRCVLQVAFLGCLGALGGGADGRAFALLGASVHVLALATVVRGADVLVDDRIQGTLRHYRTAATPMFALVAARWTAYLVEGLLSSVLVALVVIPVLAGPGRLGSLLPALAPLVVVALSTSAFGIAVAATTLLVRGEVLLTNLSSYLLLALCGVVVPTTRLPGPLADLARLLPMRAGLLAVRAAAAGRPWLADAAAEALVGAGWLAVALLLLRVQRARSRRRGDTP